MTTKPIGMTETHQERRKNYIGASEMPAIMGFSDYQTARDIYHLKRTPMHSWDGNDATEAGHLLEPSLITFAKLKLKVETRSNVFRVEPTERIHAATLDADIIGRPEHIQAKSVGVYNSHYNDSEWGAELTEEVPNHVYVQVQQEMLVTGHERVWIPAFIANGRGYQLYRVERDEGMIALIWAEGLKFWREHVLKSVPPPDVFASLETVKRFKRKPDVVAEVPGELIARLKAASESRLAAEKAEKALQAQVGELLGECELGRCPETGHEVTYKEQSRTDPDRERMKLEVPDVWEKYKKESRFRVMRPKLAKGES